MKRHIGVILQYIILMVLLTLLHVYNNHAVTLMLLIFTVLIPAISIIFFLFERRKLSITVSFQQYMCYRNQENQLTFHIKNPGFYPHTRLKLYFRLKNGITDNNYVHELELFVPAHKTIDYQMPLVFMFCGVYQAELFQYSTEELFHFTGHKQDIKVSVEAVVLPGNVALPDSLSDLTGSSMNEEISELNQKGEDFSEIFDIREYEMGDKLQAVHWKLSAKSEELLVKDFASLTGEMFQLILELSYKDMRHMDSFFDLLWSAASFYVNHNMTFSICWLSSDGEFHRVSINDTDDIVKVILQLYYEQLPIHAYTFKEVMQAGSISSSHFLITTNIYNSSDNLTLAFSNKNLARMYKNTR